jgi:hypothetical protein
MRSELGRKLEADNRAQGVFHQMLLSHLVHSGANTTDAIVDQGLELFHLELEGKEIRDVLELARRKRLVKPLSDGRDAYGEEISQIEWAASQRGRDLKPPRDLSFAAFRAYVTEVTPAGPKITQVVQYLFVLVVLIGGPIAGVSKGTTSTAPDKTGAIVAIAVVVLCLGLVLYRAMSGDAKMRCAVRAWKRLHDTWPMYGRWKASALRPGLGLLAGLLVVAPLVVGLLGRHGDFWLLIPYVLGVLLWCALFFVRFRCIRERQGQAKSKIEADLAIADMSQPSEH